MSDILNKFAICANIPEDIKTEIKIFYVFRQYDSIYTNNILFVTKDDKVHGLGGNTNGCLGLGHNNEVKEHQSIPELCYKSIREFYNGNGFVLALSEKNKVFGWGKNNLGQLGQGYITPAQEYLKPNIISLFIEMNIIQVSCGLSHCMVLTSTGSIYGWGYNNSCQLGCESEDIIFDPMYLDYKFENKIETIYCFNDHSFAITTNGNVYGWGDNISRQLGINRDKVVKPKKLNIQDISRVCSNKTKTYFLSTDGSIYFCGLLNRRDFQTIPIRLDFETKFKEIHSVLNLVEETNRITIFSGNKIYVLSGFKSNESKYESFFDYYCNEYKITFKTITNFAIKPTETEKLIKPISSEKPTPSNMVQANFHRETGDKYVGYYENTFVELEKIGSGGFSEVWKVGNLRERNFAVKKVDLKKLNLENQNYCLKELENLRKVRSQYIVYLEDSWIEEQVIYIQMEYISDSLKNIIQAKRSIFNRTSSDTMSALEYLTSSEIFLEVLECVQYLHESNPPVIHRDLKPHNILVSYSGLSGRYVKICDLGLATFHENENMSHTGRVGTDGYQAPEVNISRNYGTASDIYSLGVIAMELFDIDIYNEQTYTSCVQGEKLKNLEYTIMDMTDNIVRQRPTCANLLKRYKDWTIDKRNIDTLDSFIDKIQLHENKEVIFFRNFLYEKLKDKSKILLYFDNSSISIDTQKFSAIKKGYFGGIQDLCCRIDIARLVDEACGERELIQGYLYGSEPYSIWESIKESKIKINNSKRSNLFSRQKRTDTSLSVAATKDLLVKKQEAGRERTIILFTGDRDMLNIVHTAIEEQWMVEIWSYKHSLVNDFMNVAEKSNLVKIKYIDDVFVQVTYDEMLWTGTIPAERSLVFKFETPVQGEDHNKRLKFIISTCSKLFHLPFMGKFIPANDHDVILIPCIPEYGKYGLEIVNELHESISLISEDIKLSPAEADKLQDCIAQCADQGMKSLSQNKHLHQFIKHQKESGTISNVKANRLYDLIKQISLGQYKSSKLYDFNKYIWARINQVKVHIRGCDIVTYFDYRAQQQGYQEYSHPTEIGSDDENTNKYDTVFAEGGNFIPVTRNQPRNTTHYFQQCKFGYRCKAGIRCLFSHSRTEKEFFKEHPNFYRPFYKTRDCIYMPRCNYRKKSYLCPFRHDNI